MGFRGALPYLGSPVKQYIDPVPLFQIFSVSLPPLAGKPCFLVIMLVKISMNPSQSIPYWLEEEVNLCNTYDVMVDATGERQNVR